MERVTSTHAGIEVVGNLHKPADYDPEKRYPAVVVTHPFGAVKEQVFNARARRSGSTRLTAPSTCSSPKVGTWAPAPLRLWPSALLSREWRSRCLQDSR